MQCPKCNADMQTYQTGWTLDDRPCMTWRCTNYPCYTLIDIDEIWWVTLRKIGAVFDFWLTVGPVEQHPPRGQWQLKLF